MLNPAKEVQGEAPAPPVNSIDQAIYKWTLGKFREAFVQRSLGMGNSDDSFLAAEVLSANKECYTIERKLGEGSLGSVLKIDVPRLGESYALKTCKAVRNAVVCTQTGDTSLLC